ncbi:MAG: WecB/TagA/CpsF family glycosyltransferase [Proteobacteria bacterium]|nr:WecB/TagA/CpsF family glycosyltransferase [Pseudomonadota bacterium]
MIQVKKIKERVNLWYRILDKLTVCDDTFSKEKLINRLTALNKPTILSFVNAHALNIAWKDNGFAETLLKSDVLLLDGIGVKILLKLIKYPYGLNFNGTDFIPELLEKLPKSKQVAVYGTREPFLSKGIRKIQGMGYSSISVEHGFHPDKYYIEKFQSTSPDIIILAMGMFKQEKISIVLREVTSGRAILVINGGAIIDFLGERFPRAPKYMREHSLEWLYRLLQEPRRLWRRNLGSIVFLMRALICFFYMNKQ